MFWLLFHFLYKATDPCDIHVPKTYPIYVETFNNYMRFAFKWFFDQQLAKEAHIQDEDFPFLDLSLHWGAFVQEELLQI